MNTPTPPTDKDALIAALLERIEVLMAQNAALIAENVRLAARVAELEAKLGLPPKTPDNSSLPPSKGSEAVAALGPEAQGQAPSRRPSAAPSQPDPPPRRAGDVVPGLRGRRVGRRAEPLRGVRPGGDPDDRAGRDARVAARGHVPVLRQAVQG